VTIHFAAISCERRRYFQGSKQMLKKALITSTILLALMIIAVVMSSGAIARGGGGGGGGRGGSGGHFGHARLDHPRFDQARFDHRFLRNQFLLGGWGWGLGWPYSEGGYSNTNVVVYPRAIPQMADGSVASTPCHWNAETFTVPSSSGGTRPVEVVSCR
jgi:hypothetical protein